jgi:hypothetical protein
VYLISVNRSPVADPLHRRHDEGDHEADEAGPHLRDGGPKVLVRAEFRNAPLPKVTSSSSRTVGA